MRFVIRSSIDEKLRLLQEAKKKQMAGVMEKDGEDEYDLRAALPYLECLG